MDFHERQIKKLAAEANGDQESPDSTLLRCYKLLAEQDKERLEAQLDAAQRGRPLVAATGPLSRFFRSMGFQNLQLDIAAEDTTSKYGEFKPVIERLGYPEQACERAIGQLAMCEIGDFPIKPDVFVITNHSCDINHKYVAQCLGDWLNVRTFYIDVPLNQDDKPNLASLSYIADQLGEFIEWAEKKVPGVKYDEARHKEILEMDAIGEKYRREICQLMKHVPCPISPQDTFRRVVDTFEPSRYPNMQKANEFLRAYRDEVGERVASGQVLYPERLRLLWSGHAYDLQVRNPSNILMERKVALPFAIYGAMARMSGLRCAPIGEVSEYGVKLSLLQEDARGLDTVCYGGPSKRYVNDALLAAREMGAQGIIHYLLLGCLPMMCLGTVVAERAERELGIPTLNLEGRMMDKDFMTQERFEERISAFIDKCFDWAGKPRQ